MKPREELDLILTLIRKYNLPLSPILEYAVNGKKEEYPEDPPEAIVDSKPKVVQTKVQETKVEVTNSVRNDKKLKETNSSSAIIDKYEKQEVRATIQLTRQIIERAQTPNGGYTRSQLEAIGISWPPQEGWVEQKIGTFVTPSQLEKFYRIEYVKTKSDNYFSSYSKGTLTYKDIAFDKEDEARLKAVLSAMKHFYVPATPHDIARAITRDEWGFFDGEDSVDTILKRLPEVEYVPWGKYILKSKKK